MSCCKTKIFDILIREQGRSLPWLQASVKAAYKKKEGQSDPKRNAFFCQAHVVFPFLTHRNPIDPRPKLSKSQTKMPQIKKKSSRKKPQKRVVLP
jgi:hypothetical protein